MWDNKKKKYTFFPLEALEFDCFYSRTSQLCAVSGIRTLQTSVIALILHMVTTLFVSSIHESFGTAFDLIFIN